VTMGGQKRISLERSMPGRELNQGLMEAAAALTTDWRRGGGRRHHLETTCTVGPTEVNYAGPWRIYSDSREDGERP